MSSINTIDRACTNGIPESAPDIFILILFSGNLICPMNVNNYK